MFKSGAGMPLPNRNVCGASTRELPEPPQIVSKYPLVTEPPGYRVADALGAFGPATVGVGPGPKLTASASNTPANPMLNLRLLRLTMLITS